MAYFEILVALLFGVATGIVTGLIPGIHVNLISVLVLSFSGFLLKITEPVTLAVYIISLALTHSFLDSIPSIYLGAPDEAQALNVLPGHRLLQQGEGHNAITYTLLGSFGCLLIGVLLFPLFIKSMAFIYPLVKNSIGLILIVIITIMILKDKGKRVKSATIFFLSGVLGLLVLTALPQLKQPLFGLLSGLFGVSLLVVSLEQKATVPKQDLSKPLTISNKNVGKALGAATGVGFIAAFLPGFSSSQAAIVATNIVGDIGDEGFLTLVGGINTANMLISIATVFALSKARNGAIVVVKKMIGEVTLGQVVLFLFTAVIVGGLAVILALKISKIFARLIVKVSYAKVIITILVFITLLTIYFDGLLGLLILLTATALGIVASSLGVGKNHLMGCLILPVILFFVL